MINIYIDPFNFACPQQDGNMQQFEDYVNNLLLWNDFKNTDWANILITERTMEILFDTGDYPLWDNIKSSILSYGLVEIQAKDIIDVVEGLLKTTTVEHYLKNEDIIYQDCTCNPLELIQSLPEEYRISSLNLMVQMALVDYYINSSETEQIYINRILNFEFKELNISAKILKCNQNNFSKKIPHFPYDIDYNFKCSKNMLGLYKSIDPIKMWKTSKSDEQYKMALLIYIYQRNIESGLNNSIEAISKWDFGKKFILSVKIFQENMVDTHALRTGKGPEDPQKKRGEDKAWRRDIDYTFHLHYWLGMNSVEFAKIVIHDDMSIPI
ncbi:hypothetical protein BHU72_09955 [Desulfuribacillus stibiiarsenatis]|uniref:Uncharacterized protein n=1 Tax=Desulfuribacillus stibiiarsenatis TaxID=1390249 RepID=A0A1E5L8V1_9FIRM|nr:hypothetical protein [Desulfuribacillus stibiiarsenatis]OEH86575.1 hypothetical protein BHU72_09955 [Desulfuribacillus stibiiarsenatis]